MLLAQCQFSLVYLSKNEKITMKIFGAALCLEIIIGSAAKVGIDLYFDILSFFALSGGIVFLGDYKIGPAEVLSPLIILYGFAIN